MPKITEHVVSPADLAWSVQECLLMAQRLALTCQTSKPEPDRAIASKPNAALLALVSRWSEVFQQGVTQGGPAGERFAALEKQMRILNLIARPVCETILAGAVDTKGAGEIRRQVLGPICESAGQTLAILFEAGNRDITMEGAPDLWAEMSSAEQDSDDEQLLWDIVQGLRRGEFVPYFQPQVAARSGKLVGFEVLVRWNHPERGVLTPFHFLESARRAGILPEIDSKLIDESLANYRGWLDQGLIIPKISLNMTAERLLEDDVVDSLLQATESAKLIPSQVGIEILESVLIESGSTQIITNANRLAEAGFALELDDFGTGHAAMSNLRHFRVERIKIDRGFITDIHLNGDLAKITAAMIGLAHSLRIDALAEGVEKPEERMVLNALGCDFIQGFGISKPLPRDDVATWIRTSQGRRTLPARKASAA